MQLLQFLYEGKYHKYVPKIHENTKYQIVNVHQNKFEPILDAAVAKRKEDKKKHSAFLLDSRENTSF